jgi:hypothetical protein
MVVCSQAGERALGAAIVGFIFWLGMLYPLIPTTLMGWIIEAVAGDSVAILAAVSIIMIGWLQRRKKIPCLISVDCILRGSLAGGWNFLDRGKCANMDGSEFLIFWKIARQPFSIRFRYT